MTQVSQGLLASAPFPETISPGLLANALSLLSNTELDCLDIELCVFEETGVATPRVNRVFEVLRTQEARRRSRIQP